MIKWGSSGASGRALPRKHERRPHTAKREPCSSHCNSDRRRTRFDGTAIRFIVVAASSHPGLSEGEQIATSFRLRSNRRTRTAYLGAASAPRQIDGLESRCSFRAGGIVCARFLVFTATNS
jgi:hypothetical protein